MKYYFMINGEQKVLVIKIGGVDLSVTNKYGRKTNISITINIHYISSY